MGTWHERLMQAFLNRDSETRNQLEERRRELEAQRRNQQEGTERERQSVELAQRILGEVGAAEILDRVRYGVWRTGHIAEYLDTVALTASHRGNYSESGSSDYGYVPRSYYGNWVDHLSLSVSIDGFSLKANSLHIEDSRKFATLGVGSRSGKSSEPFSVVKFVTLYEGDLVKTKAELENVVLGMCESRISRRTLPQDLK